MRDEGMKALERSASARGGFSTPRTQRELARYVTGLASQETNNAFNRQSNAYNINSSRLGNNYNRLASLANVGQVTSNNLANMGAGYGINAGNTMMNIANARAAGLVGAANARTQGINNLLNLGGQMGAAYFASDRKLKRNISQIGWWKGFKKFKFRYKNRPEWFIGLMADDVEKKRPDAVMVMDNGFKAVNYGVL